MNEERLLVIDNDPVFCDVVSNAAKSIGYAVEAAPSARFFRQAYSHFRPTAVVLELLLPDEDGIQLLKFLGQVRSPARIMIISRVEERFRLVVGKLAEAYGLRLFANLPKPIRLEALHMALDCLRHPWTIRPIVTLPAARGPLQGNRNAPVA